MMRGASWKILGWLVLGWMLGGPALAQETVREGYLQSGAFDLLAVLPSAPVQGDARDQADRKIFRQTRAFAGSPRWVLAISDVKTDTASMMSDFSCAAGIVLTPASAPHLAALLDRAARDTGHQTGLAKNFYKRERPFKIDHGEICEPASDVANSFDYPSGHTTLGWTWATILAELLPDRATPILARGRAYGESRVVCGVHNASAVEGGRLSAAATLSAVRATPTYKVDFEAARGELTALQSLNGTLASGQCREERNLIEMNIFAPK
jgi:acid phosphatase (class A)